MYTQCISFSKQYKNIIDQRIIISHRIFNFQNKSYLYLKKLIFFAIVLVNSKQKDCLPFVVLLYLRKPGLNK